MTAVGDTLWLFDQNRRIYADGQHWAPIFREHFVPVKIVGETAKSWLIDNFSRPPLRVNKKTMQAPDRHWTLSYYTADGVEDACWRHENRPVIVESVSAAPVSTLRKIHALLAECGE